MIIQMPKSWWKVLQIGGELKTFTLSQVQAELKKQGIEWERKTVNNAIQRLTQNGFLTAEKQTKLKVESLRNLTAEGVDALKNFNPDCPLHYLNRFRRMEPPTVSDGEFRAIRAKFLYQRAA